MRIPDVSIVMTPFEGYSGSLSFSGISVMNRLLEVTYYTGAGLFFAQAVWERFVYDSRDLFIEHFQTGLLFLILASLSKLIAKAK